MGNKDPGGVFWMCAPRCWLLLSGCLCVWCRSSEPSCSLSLSVAESLPLCVSASLWLSLSQLVGAECEIWAELLLPSLCVKRAGLLLLVLTNMTRLPVMWRSDPKPLPAKLLSRKKCVWGIKKCGFISLSPSSELVSDTVQAGRQERQAPPPPDMIGNMRPFSPTLRCLSWNVDHWTVKVSCGMQRSRGTDGVMNGAQVQINNRVWHRRSASVPLWPHRETRGSTGEQTRSRDEDHWSNHVIIIREIMWLKIYGCKNPSTDELISTERHKIQDLGTGLKHL